MTSKGRRWVTLGLKRAVEVCCGARAVPADKAECRLWVQKGDDRRNAPQRARCADSGYCRHGGQIGRVWARTPMVSCLTCWPARDRARSANPMEGGTTPQSGTSWERLTDGDRSRLHLRFAARIDTSNSWFDFGRGIAEEHLRVSELGPCPGPGGEAAS